jgi:hypothetical protein
MRRRPLFALLVVLALLPLYPLAFAAPIDPSYPGGLYDNGDLDDVIEFLCGHAAAVTPAVGLAIEPCWIVVASVREHDTPACDRAGRWTRATRAPPRIPPLSA